MTLWDLLLVYLLSKLFGPKGPGVGPTWPAPPGGGPPVPPKDWGKPPEIPPVEIPPFEIPPANVPPFGGPPPGIEPPGGTTWKGYYYVQPDAGSAYGTPYTMAQKWAGKGNAWPETYNATRGWRMGSQPEGRYPAEIGDKLLIPFAWPETTDAKLLARITPIPVGTPLPGVESKGGVHGDESPETV